MMDEDAAEALVIAGESELMLEDSGAIDASMNDNNDDEDEEATGHAADVDAAVDATEY